MHAKSTTFYKTTGNEKDGSYQKRFSTTKSIYKGTTTRQMGEAWSWYRQNPHFKAGYLQMGD